MSKGIIYQAKGRAAEYCALAASMYRGCGHGCTYCYVPDVTHQKPIDFSRATARENVLYRLRGDAIKLRHEIEGGHIKASPVLMSFACDPYQPLDSELELTREAIKILHCQGIPVMILTKGGARAVRDFDLLGSEDWFGVTMTCMDYEIGDEWEPHAAPFDQRVNSLIIAHERGIKTWVSLEPVLYPGISAAIVELLHPVVDHWKVGKLNYHPRADEIDWREFAANIRANLEHLGCDYYMKKDLAAYLKEGQK